MDRLASLWQPKRIFAVRLPLRPGQLPPMDQLSQTRRLPCLQAVPRGTAVHGRGTRCLQAVCHNLHEPLLVTVTERGALTFTLASSTMAHAMCHGTSLILGQAPPPPTED